jgi:hypothetical protein
MPTDRDRVLGTQVLNAASPCPHCGCADPSHAKSRLTCSNCGSGVTSTTEPCTVCGSPQQVPQREPSRQVDSSQASPTRSKSRVHVQVGNRTATGALVATTRAGAEVLDRALMEAEQDAIARLEDVAATSKR